MKKTYSKNDFVIKNKTGSSMLTALMVLLVIMIIGSAVAYATVQLFKIVRNEEHNQMTYIAAESAIERCISNLDHYITKENFATDRGIVFSNEKQFIDDIIDKLNVGDSEIKINYSIPVYADSSMNNADVKMSFSWDRVNYKRVGNKVRFPLEITATAEMENGIFKSYGRKAVAVKEYEVWIYKPFFLNGAVYTLGDLVAKGSGTSTINGDVYVFGTGLDKPNRMEQYYMGGICATDSAILHIQNGSAFTRNLLRVGTFDEIGSSQCAIVVDQDVVAEGIQAFGINDSIVIIRDAYTFDDIEMNGAVSYIAINGNYFGMNPGDGGFHDTSSAVINTSPRYAGNIVNEFTQSRIVINGYAFVNGSAFKLETDGLAGHKLENVALAWDGNQPVYLKKSYTNTTDYINALIDGSLGERNGFSVLIGDVGWTNNAELKSDWTQWKNWINEIRSRANGRTNNLVKIPNKIKGFCNYAMAANNKLYPASEEYIEIPDSVVCYIGNKIEGLDLYLLNNYITAGNWVESTDMNTGIPKGLEVLMGYLESQVHVFARKEYPTTVSGEINYKYNLGMSSEEDPALLESTTEFLRIRDELDKLDTSKWGCIVKFDDDGSNETVYLVDYLESHYSNPTDHFLIVNLNPDRELVITRDMNGIIFTMGKVTIENGATINGAIIAAGRGYDSASGVQGSAADIDDSGNPRLPRIVGTQNVPHFRNWDYAALVFDNGGGNIIFEGREELFEKFTEEKNGDKFSEILKEIF